MAQIVESYPSQPLLLEELWELDRKIPGLDQIPDLINADIANKILYVRSSEVCAS